MAQDFTGTVLVAGASRGLGLGLARQWLARGWNVVATERPGRSSPSLATLRASHRDRLSVEPLDVTDEATIEALAGRLGGHSLDLLFVNAGIATDPAQTIGAISTQDWTRVLDTNALGPMRLVEALEGALRLDATVAVMSSGLGSVANNTSGGWEAYRASKAALNTLLRSVAARRGGARTYRAVSPGWVRTEMGGPDATLDVETSARGIVDMLDQHRGRGGAAFVDYRGQTVAW